jgi:formylglycine-generating enzyme required for sulfatase activity
MRFRRVGETRGQWWSVWETRVLDFAFFLQAEGRGSGEAGDFWKQPGFPLTPTQPVVGVDWDTARRFAVWVGEHHPSRQWHKGRLPTLGDQRHLAGLLRPDESPATGIFPDRVEWNEPHYLAQYRDPRLQPGDFIRPVAQGRANSLGLHDLQGGAWEWLGEVQERSGETRSFGDSTAWLVQGGGGFGEISFHGFRPPTPETRLVGRKDAIGFRVLVRIE